MSDLRERSSFIGKRIPIEVKQLSKHLKTADVGNFTSLVKVASIMLSTMSPSHQQFLELTQDLDGEVVTRLYPGVLTILQQALRLPINSLKKKEFLFDLTQLNIPAKFHGPLVEVLFSEERLQMVSCLHENRPRLSSVEDFKWRVDVGISTTSLKRALEPSILCSITTSKNQNHIFEMSKDKFHELRHAVAEVLNHMQQLEKRSVMKIET